MLLRYVPASRGRRKRRSARGVRSLWGFGGRKKRQCLGLTLAPPRPRRQGRLLRPRRGARAPDPLMDSCLSTRLVSIYTLHYTGLMAQKGRRTTPTSEGRRDSFLQHWARGSPCALVIPARSAAWCVSRTRTPTRPHTHTPWRLVGTPACPRHGVSLPS